VSRRAGSLRTRPQVTSNPAINPRRKHASRATGKTIKPCHFLAAGALALSGAAHAAGPACSTYSGTHTTALVELYTSEGCDSCPAADHWLSSLFAQGFRPDQVVPLALHVDYWDYMGWKDPFARGEFSLRQRKLAQMRRPVVVYTPQVLLQGQDFRRWASGAFAAEVTRINSRAARARIALTIRAVEPKAIHAEIVAQLFDPAGRKNAAVYLAAYENQLASEVSAGENRGRSVRRKRRPPPWTTLHLCPSARSPLINRGKLFKQTGPLLLTVAPTGIRLMRV